MDTLSKQDCSTTIRRIQALLDCGILEPQCRGHLLQESAFIELMINLRDLLRKAEKFSTRVSFTEGVLLNNYVKDVTDAVTAVRDSCCHIDSFKQHFDSNGNRGAFNVCVGKGVLMQIGDQLYSGDYEDDIAYFYGPNRVYLKRHIVRSFEQAKSQLEPLL